MKKSSPPKKLSSDESMEETRIRSRVLQGKPPIKAPTEDDILKTMMKYLKELPQNQLIGLYNFLFDDNYKVEDIKWKKENENG